jgi:hypothetical protein
MITALRSWRSHDSDPADHPRPKRAEGGPHALGAGTSRATCRRDASDQSFLPSRADSRASCLVSRLSCRHSARVLSSPFLHSALASRALTSGLPRIPTVLPIVPTILPPLLALGLRVTRRDRLPPASWPTRQIDKNLHLLALPPAEMAIDRHAIFRVSPAGHLHLEPLAPRPRGTWSRLASPRGPVAALLHLGPGVGPVRVA